MPGEEFEQLLKQFGVELFRATVDGYPDEYLNQLLEVFHNEFERRNPELGRWSLVQDEESA